MPVSLYAILCQKSNCERMSPIDFRMQIHPVGIFISKTTFRSCRMFTKQTSERSLVCSLLSVTVFWTFDMRHSLAIGLLTEDGIKRVPGINRDATLNLSLLKSIHSYLGELPQGVFRSEGARRVPFGTREGDTHDFSIRSEIAQN